MNFISYLYKGFHNTINLWQSNTQKAHTEYIKHKSKMYNLYPKS